MNVFIMYSHRQLTKSIGNSNSSRISIGIRSPSFNKNFFFKKNKKSNRTKKLQVNLKFDLFKTLSHHITDLTHGTAQIWASIMDSNNYIPTKGTICKFGIIHIMNEKHFSNTSLSSSFSSPF